MLGSILDARPGAPAPSTSNGVETIYHAAAYKHVPIVEHNAVAGLRNNTFGTAVLAEAAERGGVERFVLISTDKAVRPTSIMGASKRLAEMILQARAADGTGAHRLHDGALRQRARQLGLGGAQVPPADRGRRAGDRHAPRRDPLFHVDPRGGGARDPGRRHGHGRRRVRARHGRAGEDRRPRQVHDPADGPRGARRRRIPTATSPSSTSACATARSCTRSCCSARTSRRPSIRAFSRATSRCCRQASWPRVMDALRAGDGRRRRAGHPCRAHASRGRLSSGAAPPASEPAHQWQRVGVARSHRSLIGQVTGPLGCRCPRHHAPAIDNGHAGVFHDREP